MTAFTIRPATKSDIPFINSIHHYYVENTIATFALSPLTESDALAKLSLTISSGLPYLVAVRENEIWGYTYVSPFRSAKGGYLYTVELTIYVHPQLYGTGVGTALLQKIVHILNEPDKYGLEWIGQDRRNEKKVREVIAVMAVDQLGREEGEGLTRWYKRFGFEDMGRLKKVGWKFDRW